MVKYPLIVRWYKYAFFVFEGLRVMSRRLDRVFALVLATTFVAPAAFAQNAEPSASILAALNGSDPAAITLFPPSDIAALVSSLDDSQAARLIASLSPAQLSGIVESVLSAEPTRALAVAEAIQRGNPTPAQSEAAASAMLTALTDGPSNGLPPDQLGSLAAATIQLNPALADDVVSFAVNNATPAQANAIRTALFDSARLAQTVGGLPGGSYIAAVVAMRGAVSNGNPSQESTLMAQILAANTGALPQVLALVGPGSSLTTSQANNLATTLGGIAANSTNTVLRSQINAQIALLSPGTPLQNAFTTAFNDAAGTPPVAEIPQPQTAVTTFPTPPAAPATPPSTIGGGGATDGDTDATASGQRNGQQNGGGTSSAPAFGNATGGNTNNAPVTPAG